MSEKTINKVPNVPNLRFHKFTSDWLKCPLGKIASFYKGTGISKEQLSLEGNECILYGELYTKYKTETITDIKSKTNIPTKGLFFSKSNDVIIPTSGETPVDIATACCVTKNDVLLGGDLNIIRLHSDNGSFISCQLNGKRKYDIAKIAQGASIVHLHNEDLKKLVIFKPQSLIEQELIAEVFSKIDKRIELQSKIIEDLKLLKFRLIDSLIGENIPNCIFENLYNFASEGGTPSTSKMQYYENGTIPFVKIDDLKEKYLQENRDYITEDGLSNSSAWLIPTNSIIYSNGATIGKLSINTYPIATKQGILGIIPSKLVIPEYMYYFMQSKYFRKEVHKITVKGTMDCAYLKDLSKIKCYIPSIKEQEKDIAILNCLDEKIKIEYILIKKYKEQKKFLLSNMFI